MILPIECRSTHCFVKAYGTTCSSTDWQGRRNTGKSRFFFERQKDLYIHLEQTAAEDWVAEDEKQGLVGWARSIERNGHLQLTHFFVDTSSQGKGIGRGLLDRAFPTGRGQQRSIIATTNNRALSLYLRYGVNFRGMAFSFIGKPQLREIDSDLEVSQVPASTKSLRNIVAIDSKVLGYERPVDLEFFMRNQPAFLFRRNGKIVAYAFSCNGNSAGPSAALSAADLPILLQQIERSACELKLESLELVVPAAAQQAVAWALESGYKIDPFHEVLLSSTPTMNFDRYIMTQSAFVW